MQSGDVLALDRRQLSALAQTHELFTGSGIDYWLFGGWAVDFHVGSITRHHDDIDVAVWLGDQDRVARILEAEGGSMPRNQTRMAGRATSETQSGSS